MGKEERILGITFVGLLIDLFAFTAILPLFPAIIQHYLDEQGDNSGILLILKSLGRQLSAANGEQDGVLIGGIMGFIFSFLQFLSSFLIGKATDLYGRKPILLLCLLGTILSHFLWFFADSFLLFFLSRAVAGMSKGIVQISSSIVADVTLSRNRTRGMALIGIAFSIGFTIGPALGVFFASKGKGLSTLSSLSFLPFLSFPSPLSLPHSFSLAALFALSLSVFDLFFFLIFLPETKPKVAPSKEEISLRSIPMKEEKRKKVLEDLHLVHFLFLFLFSGVESTLTFLAVECFSFSTSQNGKLLAFIGLFSSLIQGGYLRRMGFRLGEERVAEQGLLSFFAGVFFLSLASFLPSFPLFALGICFFSFTSAVEVSCLTSLTSLVAPMETNGFQLGRLRSWGQLGRAFGPLFLSFLFRLGGSFPALLFSSFLVFFPLYVIRRIARILGQERAARKVE